MAINIKKLAAELATSDDKSGLDLDVVQVTAVLAALGNKLRECETTEALEILAAIAGRAGTK